MPTEKTFTTFLLINWKTGEILVRKRAPKATGTEGDREPRGVGYWVPLKVNITLVVPSSEPEINVHLVMSETKAIAIAAEEMSR